MLTSVDLFPWKESKTGFSMPVVPLPYKFIRLQENEKTFTNYYRSWQAFK